MKLIRTVIILCVVSIIVVWGIGHYLGPDDLRSCETEPSHTTPCTKVDAIVAISGGDTTARASEAIHLYRRGWADLLIFSGAAADKSGPSNAEVMKTQAISAGVPEDAIIVETTSETTSQNATAASTIFLERDISSIILVTSAYHQRRAAIEFQYHAPDVTLRSHPVTSDKQWNSVWWWLTPTGWALAMPELAGSLIISAEGAVPS